MADIQFDVKVSVEIFPDVVDRLLDSPDGPVGLLVKGAAAEVLKFAKLNIGDTFGGHHPGPRLAETGRVDPIGGSAYAVTFDKPLPSGQNLATLHHEGAGGHSIGAPGKILVRKAPLPTGHGSNANGFFRRGVVQHPGHGRNPYLRDAAETVGLRPSGTLLRGTRPASIFRLRQP